MKNQNSMRKRFASLFLILAVTVTMCLGMPGISFAGDQLNPVDMKIIVDAKDPVTVKAYNASLYLQHLCVYERHGQSAQRDGERICNDL